MSKTVDMAALTRRAAEYGGLAYLITIGDNAQIHTSAVFPGIEAATVTVGGISRHTLANTGQNPNVTLVWPPADPDGYSLIVDGAARNSDDGVIHVTPSRAVLHRPALREGDPLVDSTCKSDCIDLWEAAAVS
ncbi:hypothetical protein GCM10022240_27230 [Microbacterium kribbense]|uniref:Pyridoxamine 5'-phosphate oxidase family protein n=1 Tax=Microbacterium kribbense TaxID=433645 RepID=A0ABP7GRG6_9MICO